MEHFITGIAGAVTAAVAMLICVPHQTETADGKSSGFSNDPKAIVAFFLCCFDIRSMRPDGFGEIIIAAVVALIGFVLLFYLIYGVMSLLKISGEDVADRRSKAFWVNAAITVALNLLVSV